RIEPGEVESVLLRHPGVAEVTVVARQDAGHKRLVAYLVPNAVPNAVPGVGEPTADELRDFAGDALPDHMVPSAFVTLDRLPMSPNGKVDRSALPAPDPAAEVSARYVAPRDATERIFAGIFAGVLGLDRVGVEDSFFTLGGDSVLSIQVVARARQSGLRIATKDVFLHQTVAALAKASTVVEDGNATSGPVTGPVPLTPIQHWFLAGPRTNPHHFNQSHLVELSGPPDVAALRRALGALLAPHDALRMRFERIDGQWRQHNAGLEPVEILTVVDLPSQPKQSKQPQQTFQPRQPAQHGQPAHPREPRLSPAMEAM